MKAVILAGGFGTRLQEETAKIPKPMVEIGDRPILWHIMKVYSSYGLNEFVICLGYKGEIIKEYFLRYYERNCDVTVQLQSGETQFYNASAEPWRVTLIDTGMQTMTGGRLKRVAPYLGDEPFCMTYGDGLSDVDIRQLIAFHRQHGRLATVTAVRQSSRFGVLDLDGPRILNVREKAAEDGTWINGGFFVLDVAALNYVSDDNTIWERQPLERLAQDHQLMAYHHSGFWQPMDTLRDKMLLEGLWRGGAPPWKTWR